MRFVLAIELNDKNTFIEYIYISEVSNISPVLWPLFNSVSAELSLGLSQTKTIADKLIDKHRVLSPLVTQHNQEYDALVKQLHDLLILIKWYFKNRKRGKANHTLIILNDRGSNEAVSQNTDHI